MSDSSTRVLPRGLGSLRRGPAETPTPSPGGATAAPRKPLRLAAATSMLTASAGVWAGLALAAVGFGVIFYSWTKIAALLDVGRQMPYVVSGGMAGLGLIIVGVAVVDMAVRRQDRLERRQQILQMGRVLEELRTKIEQDKQPWP